MGNCARFNAEGRSAPGVGALGPSSRRAGIASWTWSCDGVTATFVTSAEVIVGAKALTFLRRLGEPAAVAIQGLGDDLTEHRTRCWTGLAMGAQVRPGRFASRQAPVGARLGRTARPRRARRLDRALRGDEQRPLSGCFVERGHQDRRFAGGAAMSRGRRCGRRYCVSAPPSAGCVPRTHAAAAPSWPAGAYRDSSVTRSAAARLERTGRLVTAER